MFFYRLYQIFIMAPLMIIDSVVLSVITIVMSSIFGGRFWGYYPPMLWARIMAWVTPVSVTVKGRENVEKGKSYVFVANHQGAYDIFAVYGFLGHNFKWMMKKSLEKIPFIGFACKSAGHIFVDKSSPGAVHATMVKAEKQLAGGMSVVVFPEGTRTKNGKLGTFKRGAFMLATEFGLPVVPITIDGSYRILPTGEKLPRPGHITLTIHKPIEAVDGTHDLQTLMRESREAIASSLPEDEL